MPSSSSLTTSAVLLWVFKPTTPYTTWTPASSRARAHPMFASSSKRALTSTSTATSVPDSAASMRDLTTGLSPEVL